ncbi:MAG: hypothetical protein IIB66_03535, partial [Proteobacteria bacterium]|nr:hypothetical protein [Pseudomonadota bacterium]
ALTEANFNFADVDAGNTLQKVQITALQSAGDLELNGSAVTLNQLISQADVAAGNLKFTGATDANGTGYATFGFKVHDGTALSSSAYTMTVDVTAVNDAPTGGDQTITAIEDTALAAEILAQTAVNLAG